MDRLSVVAGAASKLPLVAAIVMTIVTGCGSSGPRATANPTLSPPPPSPTSGSGSSPTAQDIWSFAPLGPIEPGTYFIDPDLNASLWSSGSVGERLHDRDVPAPARLPALPYRTRVVG